MHRFPRECSSSRSTPLKAPVSAWWCGARAWRRTTLFGLRWISDVAPSSSCLPDRKSAFPSTVKTAWPCSERTLDCHDGGGGGRWRGDVWDIWDVMLALFWLVLSVCPVIWVSLRVIILRKSLASKLEGKWTDILLMLILRHVSVILAGALWFGVSLRVIITRKKIVASKLEGKWRDKVYFYVTVESSWGW